VQCYCAHSKQDTHSTTATTATIVMLLLTLSLSTATIMHTTAATTWNRMLLQLTAVDASLQRLTTTVVLSCLDHHALSKELLSGSTVVTVATSLTADLLTVARAVVAEKSG
jgi:hypothetical protein